MFNEGYSATGGEGLVRGELCDEAIRLGKLLAALMPDEPEVARVAGADAAPGLAPRCARGAGGELVLLEDQDRRCGTRSDRGGRAAARAGVVDADAGPYQLQAAIAAVHSEAAERERDGLAADRRAVRGAGRVRSLTGGRAEPRGRCVSGRGAVEALELVEQIEGLDDYHLLHSTRANLLGRLGREEEARAAYGRALELASNEVERAFLAARVAALQRN